MEINKERRYPLNLAKCIGGFHSLGKRLLFSKSSIKLGLYHLTSFGVT